MQRDGLLVLEMIRLLCFLSNDQSTGFQGINCCGVFSENKSSQCSDNDVVSVTAKALGESKWTDQKNSAECRYLRPWRRRPRWIHFTFFARSDGGERCEVGVSLPHLSQFLLLHLEETEHTLMLLKSTSVHSAVLHWSKSSTSELWKFEIPVEQVYIWVAVKLEKKFDW